LAFVKQKFADVAGQRKQISKDCRVIFDGVVRKYVSGNVLLPGLFQTEFRDGIRFPGDSKSIRRTISRHQKDEAKTE
jgi:hypothetical protein